MQGIVFTYKNRRRRKKIRAVINKQGIKLFLGRWGGITLFAFMLAAGLTVGCICSGSLSSDTLRNLDFLFTTNMPERLSGGAWGAFCAGFASDFLFLLAAFLMGLSLWGAAALPFIAFFKGFGVGVSAGYLILTFGVKGILFYVSVLLPGIVISGMALIYELNAALGIFRTVCRALFGKAKVAFKEPAALYFRRGLKYLILTFIASVTDAVLWFGLAGLFF
ncbi:MAG: hypothetical protein K6F88_08040 [Ruminococcus sp.]|nr:hypothetical protein [Ruminococcus sp.]